MYFCKAVIVCRRFLPTFDTCPYVCTVQYYVLYSPLFAQKGALLGKIYRHLRGDLPPNEQVTMKAILLIHCSTHCLSCNVLAIEKRVALKRATEGERERELGRGRKESVCMKAKRVCEREVCYLTAAVMRMMKASCGVLH